MQTVEVTSIMWRKGFIKLYQKRIEVLSKKNSLSPQEQDLLNRLENYHDVIAGPGVALYYRDNYKEGREPFYVVSSSNTINEIHYSKQHYNIIQRNTPATYDVRSPQIYYVGTQIKEDTSEDMRLWQKDLKEKRDRVFGLMDSESPDLDRISQLTTEMRPITEAISLLESIAPDEAYLLRIGLSHLYQSELNTQTLFSRNTLQAAYRRNADKIEKIIARLRIDGWPRSKPCLDGEQLLQESATVNQ